MWRTQLTSLDHAEEVFLYKKQYANYFESIIQADSQIEMQSYSYNLVFGTQ